MDILTNPEFAGSQPSNESLQAMQASKLQSQLEAAIQALNNPDMAAYLSQLGQTVPPQQSWIDSPAPVPSQDIHASFFPRSDVINSFPLNSAPDTTHQGMYLIVDPATGNVVGAQSGKGDTSGSDFSGYNPGQMYMPLGGSAPTTPEQSTRPSFQLDRAPQGQFEMPDISMEALLQSGLTNEALLQLAQAAEQVNAQMNPLMHGTSGFSHLMQQSTHLPRLLSSASTPSTPGHSTGYASATLMSPSSRHHSLYKVCGLEF
jgi:hypothetical protein